MSGGSDTTATLAGYALAGAVVLAVLGQLNGWWCGDQCRLDAQSARLNRTSAISTFQPISPPPPSDGYTEAGYRSHQGTGQQRWSSQHPEFQKWDSLAQKAGLGFNAESGYWEKEKVVPNGAPPPPQGWRKDGPGRGRWVCKTNCPPGVQRYGE